MFLRQGLGKTKGKHSTMKIDLVWVHAPWDTSTGTIIIDSEDHGLRDSYIFWNQRLTNL